MTNFFSKLVNSTTDELATGMLSSPLSSRVEQLLGAGRRFARGASIFGVVAIGVALLGTVTVSRHSPAWVAYAQTPTPPPAAKPAVPASVPAAPRPSRGPVTRLPPAREVSTLQELMKQEQFGQQLRELESARAELEKAHAELQVQKALLDSQAKLLQEEFAGLRGELNVRSQKETAALQREIMEMRNELQKMLQELKQQLR